MGLISEEDKKYLMEEFEKNLKEEVRLYIFTVNDPSCQYCKESVDIAKELGSLSDLIKVENYDLNSEMAKKLGIEHAPTTVVSDGAEYGARIRYVGIPAGYEFSSLVEDIMSVSKRNVKFDGHVKEHLDEIDKPIKIQVFVTPTCPYCPKAVRVAHKFAQYNENITGEMIEAIEFPDWADKFGVSSVPHIVINEDVQFIGAYPEENFIEFVMEAYNKIK
ncbi:MAG: protein disulfide oxidoreductase [Thermoplasmata archaeon]